MKLAWYSNSPTAPTGYGEQTRQVVRRLLRDGHEVTVLSNFGHGSGTGIQDTPLGDGQSVPVWAQGTTQYSTDILDAAIAALDPDFVVTLYDVWPLKGVTFAGKPSVSWVPVDHYPVVPEVREWLHNDGKLRPAIAMSRFGQAAMAEFDIPSAYIPHGVESEDFQPRGADKRREQRAEMEVPDDAFLIGMVAANIGVVPPRKSWAENFAAVAQLMQQRDDVYLYLHTDPHRPNGANLEYWLGFTGVDMQRVRYVDTLSYRVGMTTAKQMSYLYNAMDVLLAASAGEGFGIPVVEAMRCGVPAIVSDFSAQPELVGETGWKVAIEPLPDYAQGSWLAKPFIGSIVEALTAAYEMDDDARERMAEAVIEQSAQYDADRVYTDQWQPLLEQLKVASNKAKASRAGLNLPPGAGGLVAPNGQPLSSVRGSDTIRPKGQKRRSNKRANKH